MPDPLLLDLSHTSHTAARTGVQRVALGLRSALGGDAVSITYDPFEKRWRNLQAWETRGLEGIDLAGGKRSAHWPWRARMAGRLRNILRSDSSGESRLGHGARGLIVPEVFSAQVGAALSRPQLAVKGPRVAVFHDAIALRIPELAPPKTVARFPGYLRELAAFDGIAAVSEASKAELLGFWKWAGIANPPPVVAIPLGIAATRPPGAPGLVRERNPNPFSILCVGTIEGRKNHLALIEACETLWRRGLRFELKLIGRAQRETGAAALRLIQQLQAAGRALRYAGAATENELEGAYAEAAFTVYPSRAEGFGLPVAESLIRGKPCICSGQGALAEIAAGGGCLTVPEPTPEALAAACGRLIENPEELSALTQAAERRHFASPGDYAGRLVAFLESLRS
jgi:glycosyltransferase involved in cell wall biosynthesis